MESVCSYEKKCLTAGQSTCFLDISRYANRGGYEKSAPKGAFTDKKNRITREELRQKAKDVAIGILAVLVLSMSMIADIDWQWFGF